MPQQDQNHQPVEVTLVTGQMPPSGEGIKLQQVLEGLIPEGVFLLDNTGTRLLREYVVRGTKLPSSEEAFQARFSTKSIRKYLDYHGFGTYNVG